MTITWPGTYWIARVSGQDHRKALKDKQVDSVAIQKLAEQIQSLEIPLTLVELPAARERRLRILARLQVEKLTLEEVQGEIRAHEFILQHTEK